jgi:hypothetical protein
MPTPVSFDAEQIESTDARAAERLRQRVARLDQRAHAYAINALELHMPGFGSRLARASPTDWPTLQPAQVGLAYWAAAAWGGMISLSKDDPEIVADLPLRCALPNWPGRPIRPGAMA